MVYIVKLFMLLTLHCMSIKHNLSTHYILQSHFANVWSKVHSIDQLVVAQEVSSAMGIK